MQKMAESLDSLVTLKIKVPLSPKTKNIHTNTWIYFEAPSELGDKLDNIYGQMKSLCKQFRYTFYRKNYWYVKGVEVSYKDKTMELTLSPMATPYPQEKLNNTSNTSRTNTVKTNTKKSNALVTIKAPSWLNKKDSIWAENFVSKCIRGAKTKEEVAKKIYYAFKKHYRWIDYSNLRYTSPKGNREKAYNRGAGNCADGANILETLFLTAGLNARIKHAPNHYIIKLVIDGKVYWCDNRITTAWNTVWKGRTSNSEDNITNGVYING